jgi:hypothetical protein
MNQVIVYTFTKKGLKILLLFNHWHNNYSIDRGFCNEHVLYVVPEELK